MDGLGAAVEGSTAGDFGGVADDSATGGAADKFAHEAIDGLEVDEATAESEDEDEARDEAVDGVVDGAVATALPDERFGVGELMRLPKKVGRTFLSVGTVDSLC